MFFRRVLERKDSASNAPLPMTTTDSPQLHYNSEDSESVTYVNGAVDSEVKDSNNNQSVVGVGGAPPAAMKILRREAPIGAVQLTPLWEHILRTRRLPESIFPSAMFAEFHERLQDPEWQVRQHALRVLVDVLVVMQDEADGHMEREQLIGLLVENLGHQAPTVRKGALDCLRVYLAETAIPETVMLGILDAGLTKQAPAEVEHMGRLSCGVLLSLPALLQSTMHTPQRHRIALSTLERVAQHMDQLPQQEITLKVLTKIRELLGVHEFEGILSNVGRGDALTNYYQLCQVYGVSGKPKRGGEVKAGAWRALPREQGWRNSTALQGLDTSLHMQPNCPDKGKVIMETEIKINDDTVTMRILEADTETEESDSPARNCSKDEESTDLVCHPLLSSANSHQALVGAGIVQVISDSELDEPHAIKPVSVSEPSTPSRGLKRVTFGGEIVKMRTPDSDAASSTNNSRSPGQANQSVTILSLGETPSPPLEELQPPRPAGDKRTTALVVEIPSDNTKPLPPARPFSSQSPRHQSHTPSDPSPSSPRKRQEADGRLSPSPRSPGFRSRSTSPTGSNNISPKVPHKQIEVLHNLQRDPSPRSQRRLEDFGGDGDGDREAHPVAGNPSDSPTQPRRTRTASIISAESPATPKSWEDLDIVNFKTLMDLRSGDWRNRLMGIAQLELALSSSSNLAITLPYLDSLLRTLLSSERHFEVSELKRELLVNLISRLPLDNLEERTPQILTGLCRQGNAGANRVCKALMQRLPAGTIVAKLTSPEFLHAKSSKFRDHALQVSIFALMTFPGTCFDISLLTAQTVYSLLNRKRRVRQAALEVLAVLADISSINEVLAIVSETTAGVELGPQVLEAASVRLSRLQLPIVTPDSGVLFVFNQTDQPGSRRSGADVDWIYQGEGSASPNTIKRRRMRAATSQRDVLESTEAKNKKDGFHSFSQVNEGLHRHSFHSPPETLDMTSPTNDFSQRLSFGAKTNNGTHSFMDRRLVAKACSDTSMDGRSTDSTTTTCSSGSATSSFIQLTSRTGGQFSGANSRFPAMNQHTDFVNNFMRSMQRSTKSYSVEGPSYPKVSYSIPKSQQMPRGKLQQQHSFTKVRCNAAPCQGFENGRLNESPGRHQSGISADHLDSECADAAKSVETPRAVQPLETAVKDMTDGSPLSVRSTSYSQKSTASAKSSGSQSEMGKRSSSSTGDGNESKMEFLNRQQDPVEAFGELVVDDIEDQTEPPAHEESLKLTGSVNSLHSKTESIKTQLEDTTPQLSRAQSVKSLPIEEDIEGSNSFVVVEEVQHELESSPPETTPVKELQEQLVAPADVTKLDVANHTFGPKLVPMHEERVIHSRSISLDSIYGARPGSKQGSLDTSTSTTDNTSQSGSHLGNISIPGKVQHTPLKQKAKTSYFLRAQRRVSPVKQAIKMSQAELFPQNMARFDKPREALLKTFDQLDSSNWEMNMTGLKSMVRLIRYHTDTLDNQMHMTCIQLTRSVRNLRSQVARASCQAAAELFSLKSTSLQLECDDLVCALLHRTADTNRFIRADATRALESMVDHLQPQKVLNILAAKGAQHQNALVRTTSAKLLFRLVERLGSDRIYAMGRESRDKFFVVGANLLLEGSLETRSYAKSLFRALSEHHNYQRLLLEVIPPRTYRNVEKTLRSITR
ncbi:uncharacterized protein LOC119548746 isoform X1 [Drosophila subpulchrella]|uniref:uncharacterized protein LOC119548746 isoform X1 n=2 Tax=Drosophila subpulchrella TaxID=1486046 RepID=UPI0018A1A654|nr:uncharacterized protein LOC119548746 isoform X1 [Drosophila subpulchrella]